MSSVPAVDVLWRIAGPMLAAMPRIAAAVIVAPLFPQSLFPTLLRGAIVVSLSLYLYPHMVGDMPPALAPPAWLALIGKEAFIGMLLGVALGTLVWALESVGIILDFQIGLANAQLYDPFGGHAGGPVSAFMARLAVILLIATGGLQLLASLLFESFRIWPVASFYPAFGRPLTDFATGSVNSLVQLVARLAVPVVLMLATIDISFGVINRVVPQLNVFFFTMPIKGALAALMIALYLSFVADVVSGQIADLQHWVEHLVPVLAKH